MTTILSCVIKLIFGTWDVHLEHHPAFFGPWVWEREEMMTLITASLILSESRYSCSDMSTSTHPAHGAPRAMSSLQYLTIGPRLPCLMWDRSGEGPTGPISPRGPGAPAGPIIPGGPDEPSGPGEPTDARENRMRNGTTGRKNLNSKCTPIGSILKWIFPVHDYDWLNCIWSHCVMKATLHVNCISPLFLSHE